MTIQDKICFASDQFERQALKRSDREWIEQQLDDETSLFLLFHQNRFLATDAVDIHYLDKSTATGFSHTPIHWNYLGELQQQNPDEKQGGSVFAAEILQATTKAEQANWRSLRSLAKRLPAQEASMLAYCQGLLHWHEANRFCSHCGHALQPQMAGHARKCSNDRCAKERFPRVDPAIIVLVQHQDCCLLARATNWPDKVYSCLAGFVETGEDLESAVHREVFEEAGLELQSVTYRGSQPWPFPRSLMLGFHAEAKDKSLTFHDGEIQDGRWFNRQQLLEAVANGELKLSSSLSISYQLLEDWFNLDSNKTLSELLMADE